MYLLRIPQDQHAGLIARTAPGTHPAIIDMLIKNNVPKGKSIDLAAGTGSLISRLDSAGYGPLEAIELDIKNFGVKNVEPKALDLNKNFTEALGCDYSLVTASEIIEHLDSPRLFLEKIYSMIKPGGYAIISTPNVSHWLGRIQFLLTGNLKYFTPQDFEDQRHITPILDFHLRVMLKEVGFKLVEFRCTSSSWGILLKAMLFPFRLFFYLLGSKNIDGNVNIYLVQKQ